MTSLLPSEQPQPKTLAEFSTLIPKVLGSVAADDMVGLQQKASQLQQSLFSVGVYLRDKISDAEIDAIVASPWNEYLSWIKAHWVIELGAAEKEFLESIAVSYAKGPADPGFPRALVLARLFLTCYRHTPAFDWRNLPLHCLRNFVDFQFESSPSIYPGDGKVYVQHMERTLENVLSYARTENLPRGAAIVALNIFMEKFEKSHLMMRGGNLLRIMRLRNEILRHALSLSPNDVSWTPPPRDPARKIRIGIISKTLMAGGETWAMLANISALDKSKYEIVLFYFALDAGYTHDLDFYRELGRTVDRAVPIPMDNFKACVAAIRKQDIDILWHQSNMGLMECGHTALAFTHKLARVECAMFAMHATTTGNPYFDYYINVEPVFPPKTWANEYSEKELNVKGRVIYIPERWDHAPNLVINRDTLKIPPDAIVYFGGAAYAKYNGEFPAAWLKIIKNVPNSYLVVYPLNPAWAPHLEGVLHYHMRLQHALREAGVSPDRIRIIGNVNGEAIIHMHGWGHMYLDSFPYGGVTSVNDAIRGGLCPIVFVGQSSLENGDANILTSYDLKDLLVRSPEEYVEMGIRCGTDEVYREKIRVRVREAWKTKRQGFWSQVGASHAAIIDQIVEEKFESASDAASGRVVNGGR